MNIYIDKYSTRYSLDRLIGVVLEDFGWSEWSDTVFLYSTSHVYILCAVGDCCSESWFEHIELPALGVKGAKILSYDEKDLDESFEDDKLGYTSIYSFCLHTDKGDLDLELRNTSNGYYGGYVILNETRMRHEKKN